MKVTITPEFQAAYDELFLELQNIVGDNAGIPTINSLATYFNALKYLQGKNQTPSWKFYRLPLEEPTFDVDMDKRTISVPTIFQNAGLGVKGDTNAEIVFFKVPRWYDAMDLGQQECWIQWTNPNNKKNKTGNSPVVLKDWVDDDLLLGWVITSDMTEQSGNLEFALRFFSLDPNSDTPVIQYSVSTQKASCAVKNTLDLDVIAAEVDNNLQNLIITRPIYSSVINSMDGAAPIITQNLDNTKEYDLLTEGALYESFKDQYPNGVREFKVAAFSPDAVVNAEGETIDGFVRYRWYRGRDLQTDITLTPDDDGADFIATTAGTYFAQIGNEKQGAGTRWINSNPVVIPAATEITYAPDYTFHTMAYSVPDDHVNHVDLVFSVAGQNGDVKYTWTVDDAVVTEGVDGDTYTPPVDSEGKVKCVAVNHKNNTQSHELVTKNVCDLRAWPTSPLEVTVEWLPGEKALRATPTFKGPSADHADEWNFVWTRTLVNGATGQQTSQTVPESEGGLKALWNPKLSAATTAVPNVYKFYCDVSHTVFKGTALSKTSSPTTSNVITLEVDGSGNVTVK